MSKFFVLEGDNGSGKSTAAAALGADGMYVVSNDPELKDAETRAKNLRGRERIRAFYAYNRQTANKALSYGADCLVVRYWPSTLAAAFADGFIDSDELIRQCRDNLKTFPEPAVFIYLKCDHAERVRRLTVRDAPGERDDRSLSRAAKYQYAIGHMAFATPTPWTFLPGDFMKPLCVARRILDLMGVFSSEPHDSLGLDDSFACNR